MKHASTNRHFLNTQDWSRPDLDALLTQAANFKRNNHITQLQWPFQSEGYRLHDFFSNPPSDWETE